MALVFISHATSDEMLARKVAGLLGAALRLSPADFFLSSEEGHGVAPAASILTSIVDELRTVPALVVLLTPRAAASPWVWLEAGSRLGCADKSAPLFLVPSARFVSLLSPVAGQRCLQLDSDGALHELVRAVGKALGRSPVDVLDYRSALEELVACSAQEYSPAVEKRARAVTRLKRYAAGWILLAAGLGTVVYGSWLVRVARSAATGADKSETEAIVGKNEDLAASASRYLVLKGRVTSANAAVHGATVMVSREGEVRDPSACEEPDCTKRTTTTDGEFTIVLTKIKVQSGDSVVLSVESPGFEFFSKELVVDVRAMDVATAPQSVRLVPRPPG